MTTCSVLVRPGTYVARCSAVGSGTAGTSCMGTGNCLPALACDAPASGNGVCTPFCTASRACQGELRCDTATPFFTADGTTAFRCR